MPKGSNSGRADLGQRRDVLASMRHIAKEAGCWVIGTATAMQGSDVPDDFPDVTACSSRTNGSTTAMRS